MNVLVIGAGAAGCRHIENLLSMGVSVSAFRYRRNMANQLRSQFSIPVYDSLTDAFDSPQDAVIVANRPDQHMSVAREAAGRGMHIYVEKPLAHDLAHLDDLAAVAAERSLIVEIGCMLRFDPNLRAIKRLLEEGSIGPIYFAQSSVGQYLPDWRPGDYREHYSAKAEQGGGVLLDLVHELDYLTWWFGPVVEVTAVLATLSDLELSGEDIAELTLLFEGGVLAHVHMDYLKPRYERGCEIVGRGGSIRWVDSDKRVMLEHRDGEQPAELGIGGYDRNALFIDHMKHFLHCIEGDELPAVPLSESIHVMRVVSAAKKSSIQRRTVTV